MLNLAVKRFNEKIIAISALRNKISGIQRAIKSAKRKRHFRGVKQNQTQNINLVQNTKTNKELERDNNNNI